MTRHRITLACALIFAVFSHITHAAVLVVDGGIGPFFTIQSAITAASGGGVDQIHINPGTYAETGLTLDKHVDLIGQGATPADVVIDDGSALGTGLAITGSGNSFFDLILENFTINGYANSVELGDVSDITFDQVHMENATVGLLVPGTSQAAGITIDKCDITGMSEDGIRVLKDIAQPDLFGGLLVKNGCNISFCNENGMYFERLINADITNINIWECGSGSATAAGGAINLNLFGGTYVSINITGNLIAYCGNVAFPGSAACMIRARDDGAFVANPGTLGTVTIQGNGFSNLHDAIRIGHLDARNATPSTVTIQGNGYTPITGEDIDLEIDMRPPNDASLSISRDVPTKFDIDPTDTTADFASFAQAIPFAVRPADTLLLNGSITETVTIDSRINIVGAGSGTITWDAPAGAPVLTYTTNALGTSNQDLTLSGVTITGSGGATTGVEYGLDTRYIAIGDVALTGFTDYALNFPTGFWFRDFEITNTEFTGNNIAMHFGSDADVTPLTFDLNKTNFNIEGCLFDSNTVGIQFADGGTTGAFSAESWEVTNTDFTSNTIAWEVIATTDPASYINDITVTGCDFTNNTDVNGHVQVVSHGGTITGLRFIDCNFTGPSQGSGETGVSFQITATPGEIAYPVFSNTTFTGMDTAIANVSGIGTFLYDNSGASNTFGPGVSSDLTPLYELVVQSGDAATPFATTFYEFHEMGINDVNDTVFLAEVENTDPFGNLGIWRVTGGVLVDVARGLDFTPPVGQDRFQFFYDMAFSDLGTSAFRSVHQTGDAGIYYENSIGNLLLGDSDSYADTDSVWYPVMSNDGKMLSRVANNNTINDSMLRYYNDGIETDIIIEGDPVPGYVDLEFGQIIVEPRIAVTGANTRIVAFGAFLEGAGSLGPSDAAIFLVDPDVASSASLLVRKGTNIPAASGAPIQNFLQNEIALNGQSEVFFEAELSLVGPITLESNNVLLTNAGIGPLVLIAQDGSQAPGLPSGVTFGDTDIGPSLLKVFTDPMINDFGRVLFRGRLNNQPVIGNEGIWTWDPISATTTLVAMEGEVAPGTGGLTFTAFKDIALSAGGTTGKIIIHGVTDGPSETNEGFWLYDPALGSSALILRKGDELYLDGLPREIHTMAFSGGSGGNDGRLRAINDNDFFVCTLHNATPGAIDGVYIIDIGNVESDSTVSALLASPSPPIVFTRTSPTTGTVTIQNSVIGRTYQLQRTASINPANWVNDGSPIAGTGGSIVVNVTVTPGPVQFFRIVTTS